MACLKNKKEKKEGYCHQGPFDVDDVMMNVKVSLFPP